jgi:hypothetical protein
LPSTTNSSSTSFFLRLDKSTGERERENRADMSEEVRLMELITRGENNRSDILSGADTIWEYTKLVWSTPISTDLLTVARDVRDKSTGERERENRADMSEEVRLMELITRGENNRRKRHNLGIYKARLVYAN